MHLALINAGILACNHYIHLFSDNLATVHVVNNLYARSHALCLKIYQLLVLLRLLSSQITASYLPGTLNSVADWLLR